VQVLFAFLLTVPFAAGLTRMTEFERVLYLVVLLATALATFLLIAPTAYHRMVFRRGRKPELVAFANRMVLVGLGFLALAMVGAIFLVTHLLFGPAAAIPIAALAGLVIVGLWYLLPWSRSRD
jgi:preprotein translocase subunit Sss1